MYITLSLNVQGAIIQQMLSTLVDYPPYEFLGILLMNVPKSLF
jgi:hypothetical protein